LDDSSTIRRKSRRALHTTGEKRRAVLGDLETTADRIDQITRELYHLLPESLRPVELPLPYTPRQPSTSPSQQRSRPVKPGGPLPRKVRWPDWTIPKALQLIQGYLDKHRTWPTRDSGRIYEGSPDTWTGLDIALKNGNRGLPGGTTLARFIAETWRVRNRSSPLVEFDLADVLRWCDYHFARTGAWPHVDSGAVAAAPGETWGAINHALSRAVRYMGEPTSLARLLAAHRGVPNIHDQSPLTEEQILAWADLHVVRTGRWPTRTSGADVDAPDVNWKNINYALIRGNRRGRLDRHLPVCWRNIAACGTAGRFPRSTSKRFCDGPIVTASARVAGHRYGAARSWTNRRRVGRRLTAHSNKAAVAWRTPDIARSHTCSIIDGAGARRPARRRELFRHRATSGRASHRHAPSQPSTRELPPPSRAVRIIYWVVRLTRSR